MSCTRHRLRIEVICALTSGPFPILGKTALSAHPLGVSQLAKANFQCRLAPCSHSLGRVIRKAVRPGSASSGMDGEGVGVGIGLVDGEVEMQAAAILVEGDLARAEVHVGRLGWPWVKALHPSAK